MLLGEYVIMELHFVWKWSKPGNGENQDPESLGAGNSQMLLKP